jgi:2-C-methyl-D-erythritol 4-phosphate cytidylyltransferase
LLLKKYAIIVAAGSGKRMQTAVTKPFLLLREKPVLLHTIDVFLESFDDLIIVLVVAAGSINKATELAGLSISPERIKVVQGGVTRFESVKNGLAAIEDDSIVFVHDGVRCLVTKELIHRCHETALEKGNAVPAIDATDSLRMETSTGSEVIDRTKIRVIQTPQVFPGEVLKKAFEQDYVESFTDEACVVEQAGVKINLVKGETSNIKITWPVDLLVAEQLLKDRER